MYTNVHATVGTAIVLSTYAVTKSEPIAIALGGALAFLSHDPLDLIGEKNYGSKKNFFIFELSALAIFIIAAIASGKWMLFAAGWIGGNGMDLIDKKGGLSLINPNKYPYGTFFKCHRRKPKYNITLKQTQLFTIISVIVVIILSLIL